jgi:hypothetical protein
VETIGRGKDKVRYTVQELDVERSGGKRLPCFRQLSHL